MKYAGSISIKSALDRPRAVICLLNLPALEEQLLRGYRPDAIRMIPPSPFQEVSVGGSSPGSSGDVSSFESWV